MIIHVHVQLLIQSKGFMVTHVHPLEQSGRGVAQYSTGKVMCTEDGIIIIIHTYKPLLAINFTSICLKCPIQTSEVVTYSPHTVGGYFYITIW